MKAGRIAGWYRWLEYAAFGKALERARSCWLPLERPPRRVLILGEGDGRFLERLTAFHPEAAVEVLEVSPEMIERAHRRLRAGAPVRFHCQDARENWPVSGPFDLIVTHFFLDCFDEAEMPALAERLAGVLAPGGTWLLSEFRQPDEGWRRLHARVWLKIMYLFFRLTTHLETAALPDYVAQLQERGLQLEAERRARWDLIGAQRWRKPPTGRPSGPS